MSRRAGTNADKDLYTPGARSPSSSSDSLANEVVSEDDVRVARRNAKGKGRAVDLDDFIDDDDDIGSGKRKKTDKSKKKRKGDVGQTHSPGYRRAAWELILTFLTHVDIATYYPDGGFGVMV
jgi:hypothetical protein